MVLADASVETTRTRDVTKIKRTGGSIDRFSELRVAGNRRSCTGREKALARNTLTTGKL